MSRLPLPAVVALPCSLLLALVAAGTAQAQTGAVPSTRIEVTGSAVVPLDAAALSERAGAFALADGRTLHVKRSNQRLMAGVDRRGARPLEQVGPDRFATRDGRLAVAFHPAADGRVDTLTLTETGRVRVATFGVLATS
jgi:hypothetical protein